MSLTVTRSGLAAIFLCAVIALWRFQITFGNAGMPIYIALLPIGLALPLPQTALVKVIGAFAAILGLMLFVLLSGITILRPFVSLIALILLAATWLTVIAAIAVSVKDKWATMAGFLKVIIRLQVVLQVVQIAGFNLLSNRTAPHYFLPFDRPPGLLIEPSHVAITWAPLILAALWPKAKVFGGHLNTRDFFWVYVTVILCPSATMLIVILLALLLRFVSWKPQAGIVLIIVALLFAQNLVFILDFLPSEINERVQVLLYLIETGYFDERTNLSSVVFYGGATAALTALDVSPLGVGFLNMASIYGTDDLLYYRQITDDANIRDGSSMLFKLIVEFGYLGLAFAIYATLAIWRIFALRPPDVTIGLLAFPLVACFARGTSYIDGPVVIALSIILFGLHLRKRDVPSSGQKTAPTAWMKT